jgi:protein-tyrosine-phosphatase
VEGDWLQYSVIAAADPDVLECLEKTKPPGATANLVMLAPPNGIDDPWGGSLDNYRTMFRDVNNAMEPFLNANGFAGLRA